MIALAVVNNTRHCKRTHKFGIELPTTWDDCMQLDNKNGNTTYWQDALRKEMSKVKVLSKSLRT